MEVLTRKIGPLPVWAYAAIIGGALLAWRLARGGGRQDASVQLIPTGAPPIDASAGFMNELANQLGRIEEALTNRPTPTPTPANPTPTPTTPPPASGQPARRFNVVGDLGTFVAGLRKQFPAVYTAWQRTTGWVQRPGETSAQRRARLTAELRYFEANAPRAISAVSATPLGGANVTPPPAAS